MKQFKNIKFYRKTPSTKSYLSMTLLAILVLAGCGSSSKSNIAAQPKELQGLWERTGYGDIYVVGSKGAEHFQYTRQGCLEADSLNNAEMADLFDQPELSGDGSLLVTKNKNNMPYDTHFISKAMLPDICEGNDLITASTPTMTFEHLWNTFNDHYAFFDKRDVDWNEQYAELKPYVNDDLTDDELLEVFEAMLKSLNDGHVQLNADGKNYDFVEYRGANKVIFESFSEQTEFDDIQEYANGLSTKYKDIRSSYLDTGSEKSAGGENGKRVTWGTIGQQVGYLRVARMHELTTNGDNSVNANLTAINKIMQQALSDLSSTNALIIDVRANEGGEDSVSLAIANYFTDQKRLAVSKHSRSYLGETDTVESFISPANETPYVNPIAVIGSPDTASAAEIFLMSMSALPHVTLVGENSNGELSDILSKTLPNGWEVGLSNEVYTDYLGVNHEVTGVPPQIEAPTFSLESIAANKDAAINASLATLGFSELQLGN